MLYRDQKIMTQIDGLDAIDACYAYAGTVGMDVRRFTFRQLWRMFEGRMRQVRLESLQLAHLVWGISEISIERFILFGEFTSSKHESDIELSPELEERVRLEIERLRKENPHIPVMVGG